MVVDERLRALTAAIGRGLTPDARTEAVLNDPLGVVELDVLEADDRTSRVDGMLGRDGYVLGSGRLGDGIMTGDLGVLPHQLALLVGLGPRPVASAPAVGYGDAGGLDAALARGDLPPAIAAVLSEPEVLHWRATVSWAGAEEIEQRSVVVVDGGASGLLLIGPQAEGDDQAVIATASAADAWRALCGLLPADGELPVN